MKLAYYQDFRYLCPGSKSIRSQVLVLFHLKPMTKKEERYVKCEIRKLIQAQQQVLLLGGVWNASRKMAFLREQRWRILLLFGLPTSKRNLNLLGRYPFSMAIRQPDMVPERLANLYWCRWIGAWFLDGDLTMGYGNDDVTFGNIDAKVDYLFWKLCQESEKECNSDL
jgi:hypothetical protein